MASTPASMTLAGVSKSGSPISRWTMSCPLASRARARTNVSKAVSVPRRVMRRAMGSGCVARFSAEVADFGSLVGVSIKVQSDARTQLYIPRRLDVVRGGILRCHRSQKLHTKDTKAEHEGWASRNIAVLRGTLR